MLTYILNKKYSYDAIVEKLRLSDKYDISNSVSKMPTITTLTGRLMKTKNINLILKVKRSS